MHWVLQKLGGHSCTWSCKSCGSLIKGRCKSWRPFITGAYKSWVILDVESGANVIWPYTGCYKSWMVIHVKGGASFGGWLIYKGVTLECHTCTGSAKGGSHLCTWSGKGFRVTHVQSPSRAVWSLVSFNEGGENGESFITGWCKS